MVRVGEAAAAAEGVTVGRSGEADANADPSQKLEHALVSALNADQALDRALKRALTEASASGDTRFTRFIL